MFIAVFVFLTLMVLLSGLSGCGGGGSSGSSGESGSARAVTWSASASEGEVLDSTAQLSVTSSESLADLDTLYDVSVYNRNDNVDVDGDWSSADGRTWTFDGSLSENRCYKLIIAGKSSDVSVRKSAACGDADDNGLMPSVCFCTDCQLSDSFASSNTLGANTLNAEGAGSCWDMNAYHDASIAEFWNVSGGNLIFTPSHYTLAGTNWTFEDGTPGDGWMTLGKPLPSNGTVTATLKVSHHGGMHRNNAGQTDAFGIGFINNESEIGDYTGGYYIAFTSIPDMLKGDPDDDNIYCSATTLPNMQNVLYSGDDSVGNACDVDSDSALWLRVVRNGSTFSSYFSTDGENFTKAHSGTVSGSGGSIADLVGDEAALVLFPFSNASEKMTVVFEYVTVEVE